MERSIHLKAMLDWKLINRVIFGKPPPIPSMVHAPFEELLPESLTMGTLIIGRPGTGKTTSLANHLVICAKTYPERAIFVLDWSGSISDTILTLIAGEDKPRRIQLLKRVVYDDMGNSEWCMPLPEFSKDYNSTYDEQAQRVSVNLAKLEPELVVGAPYLAGLSIKELAPRICQVLTAIENEHGETWQITEAKQLLVGQLARNLPL